MVDPRCIIDDSDNICTVVVPDDGDNEEVKDTAVKTPWLSTVQVVGDPISRTKESRLQTKEMPSRGHTCRRVGVGLNQRESL